MIVGSSTFSGGRPAGWSRSHRVSRDLQVVDSGENDDVAGAGFFDFDALESVETVQVHQPRVFHRAVTSHETDGEFERAVPRLMRPMPSTPT